jgi:S1/P1 Nuclease
MALLSILLVLISLLALPVRGWAWGYDGHQIVAYIAADHLTPAARRHVAQILGVADDPSAVAAAMARAALRPDLKFRTSAPETVVWHYIYMCRQDTAADERARCPRGDCITTQLDRFVEELKTGEHDPKWNSAAQLAFVINLMGEIHQPMHAITNADRAGMCIGVLSPQFAKTLHSLWGEAMVERLEHDSHTHGPAATAKALEKRYPDSQIAMIPPERIAWESHQLAESDAYRELGIPMQPCRPTACAAPPGGAVRVSEEYIDRNTPVVARQLAIAGYRLASLLNGIWSR